MSIEGDEARYYAAEEKWQKLVEASEELSLFSIIADLSPSKYERFQDAVKEAMRGYGLASKIKMLASLDAVFAQKLEKEIRETWLDERNEI